MNEWKIDEINFYKLLTDDIYYHSFDFSPFIDVYDDKSKTSLYRTLNLLESFGDEINFAPLDKHNNDTIGEFILTRQSTDLYQFLDCINLLNRTNKCTLPVAIDSPCIEADDLHSIVYERINNISEDTPTSPDQVSDKLGLTTESGVIEYSRNDVWPILISRKRRLIEMAFKYKVPKVWYPYDNVGFKKLRSVVYNYIMTTKKSGSINMTMLLEVIGDGCHYNLWKRNKRDNGLYNDKFIYNLLRMNKKESEEFEVNDSTLTLPWGEFTLPEDDADDDVEYCTINKTLTDSDLTQSSADEIKQFLINFHKIQDHDPISSLGYCEAKVVWFYKTWYRHDGRFIIIKSTSKGLIFRVFADNDIDNNIPTERGINLMCWLERNTSMDNNGYIEFIAFYKALGYGADWGTLLEPYLYNNRVKMVHYLIAVAQYCIHWNYTADLRNLHHIITLSTDKVVQFKPCQIINIPICEKINTSRELRAVKSLSAYRYNTGLMLLYASHYSFNLYALYSLYKSYPSYHLEITCLAYASTQSDINFKSYLLYILGASIIPDQLKDSYSASLRNTTVYTKGIPTPICGYTINNIERTAVCSVDVPT